MGCIVGGTHREVLKGYFWEVLLGMPIRAYSAAINCPTFRNDDDHEKKKLPKMSTSKIS